MQPESYGPLEKQIKCLERERANNPEVMPSSLPHEQVQNAKIKRDTAVPSAANSKSNSLLHDVPSPVLSPSCGHGGLEGGFLCRKDKPSWLRQIFTSEVGDRGGEF
jgi:hypothetical protein